VNPTRAKRKPRTKKPKPRTKKPKPPTASPPERFFEKELSGDQAPSFQTMQALYKQSAAIHAAQPWTILEEDQLILFQDGGEMCFCSVLGAAGEASAVQVLIGPQSYFWFLKMHNREPISIGDYFGHQHNLFVHYVAPSELTTPDRSLVRNMGHPLTKGTEAPFFRTIRPGYHPWFVTESEAKILRRGLESVLVIADCLAQEPDADLWNEEDVYPLVRFTAEHSDRLEYVVKLTAAPREIPTMPKLPELDQPRIQSILDGRYRSAGVLEVDHFYTAAMIGAKDERKACMRIALAIDSKTAIAFPPLVSAPEESTGKMLQQVVLQAIEVKHALPAEVRVLNREYKILLDPLAESLGFRIKVQDSLPALNFAKTEIEAMLG
jgi:hypothetical protein